MKLHQVLPHFGKCRDRDDGDRSIEEGKACTDDGLKGCEIPTLLWLGKRREPTWSDSLGVTGLSNSHSRVSYMIPPKNCLFIAGKNGMRHAINGGCKASSKPRAG